MKIIDALRERWDAYRPTKTETAWFGVGCIAATLVLGFGVAGWVTGGTAQKRIDEAAANARNELAAAVCVDEFMAAKNSSTALAKLKEAGWYDRNELVAKGGWATLPGSKEPDSTVAAMCASRLAEMQAPTAALTPTSTTSK